MKRTKHRKGAEALKINWMLNKTNISILHSHTKPHHQPHLWKWNQCNFMLSA
jgi:hypothetical protein